MGMSPDAHLAYGYDLGTDEDPKFAEKGEYGVSDLPWFNTGDDEDEDEQPGFVEQLFNHLYAQIDNPAPAEYDFQRQKIAEQHYGIRVQYSGHGDYAGNILIADGSHRSVEWSDTMVLDPADLNNDPLAEGWDDKLDAAIRALGITPTQDDPKWLVFPSYG
jgi:hypothetical protein